MKYTNTNQANPQNHLVFFLCYPRVIGSLVEPFDSLNYSMSHFESAPRENTRPLCYRVGASSASFRPTLEIVSCMAPWATTHNKPSNNPIRPNIINPSELLMGLTWTRSYKGVCKE